MAKRERASGSSIRNDDALAAGGMMKGKASSLPFFVCAVDPPERVGFSYRKETS
jgi:hypothetical protein